VRISPKPDSLLGAYRSGATPLFNELICSLGQLGALKKIPCFFELKLRLPKIIEKN
jgi:hypothetical protein